MILGERLLRDIAVMEVLNCADCCKGHFAGAALTVIDRRENLAALPLMAQ
jgi:hypothetical protein